MRGGVVALVFGLIGFGSASASQSEYYEFDPGLFALWSHVIVHGELISHDDVEPRRWSADKRYTIEGRIVVHRVIRVAEGLSVASGDTLVFSYPYGEPISDDPGMEIIHTGAGKPLEVEEQTEALFALRMTKYGLMPGYRFCTSTSFMEQVDRFVARFRQDRGLVLKEMREKYSNVRFMLAYPRPAQERRQQAG